MKNRSAWIFCIGVFGFLGAQCGLEDSLSSDVEITAVPERPIVINSDLTLYPGLETERVISAPWFKVGFRIRNKSPKTAYVVTNRLTMTTYYNGNLAEGASDVDPSVTCENIDNTGRAYIVILGAGDTFVGLDNDIDDDGNVDAEFINNEGIPQYCDPTAYDTENREDWYFSGLTPSDTGIYDIRMQIEGWFVDGDDVPIERLDTEGFFNTQ